MIMTGSPGKIRPDKVTLVAVWFGINAAISLVLVAVLHFALEATTRDAAGEPDRGLVFGALFLGRFLFIVYGALGVVAIVGLLRLRNWGRWLAMILAVLGLILIPIHTIIGALIIWYLLGDEAKHAFGAASPEPTPIVAERT